MKSYFIGGCVTGFVLSIVFTLAFTQNWTLTKVALTSGAAGIILGLGILAVGTRMKKRKA